MSIASKKMRSMLRREYGHFTCFIPWEPDAAKRTEWHPTENTGPFKVLSRGAFKSRALAHQWADEKLGVGATYTVKFCF